MKHLWKLSGILLAFLAVRLYFIYTFPPFTDESLYIRWGMLMIDKPAYTWASIEHISRQPLAFWLFGLGSILFKNPILGSRLVMLLCNIPTFFLLYITMKKIFDEKIALYAVTILTFTPLFILTQTLAIMDGFLFAIAVIILSVLLYAGQKYTLFHTAIISILLAIALWIKSTGLFLVALSFVSIFAITIRNKTRPGRIVMHFFILGMIMTALILPLLTRPDFVRILQEPQTFLLSTHGYSQLMQLWVSNSITTLYSLFLYTGPVLFLTLIISLISLRNRNFVFALIWAVLPIVSLIVLAGNFRFRYASLGSICLIPFMTYGMRMLFRKYTHQAISYVFWIAVVSYCLVFTLSPVTIFRLFPLSNGERDYAISWPSGYGIPELIRWIDAQTKDKNMILAVADSPGNPSDYLLAHYYFSPNIRVIFVTVNSVLEFRKIEPLTKKIPVYLATRTSLVSTDIAPFVQEVIRFNKPLNLDAIALYRISF